MAFEYWRVHRNYVCFIRMQMHVHTTTNTQTHTHSSRADKRKYPTFLFNMYDGRMLTPLPSKVFSKY